MPSLQNLLQRACAVCFRDPKRKENLWWTFCKTETTSVYLEGKIYLEQLGYTILSVTGDGFGGLRQAFFGIPFQMCHVHIVVLKFSIWYNLRTTHFVQPFYMNKKIVLSGFVLVVLGVLFSAKNVLADSLVGTVGTGAYPNAIATAGNYVYVSNSLNGTVTAINVANNNATSTITVGNSPTTMIATGTKVYVANYGSSSISIIDSSNGNAVTNVAVGNGPNDPLAFGSKVYVTNYNDGTVSIIDTLNNNATTTVAVGPEPVDMVAIGSKIYISTYNGSQVYVIDTANGNATSSIVTPYPSSYHIAAVGTKLYIPYNGGVVSIIDTANGNATSTVSFGSGFPYYITSIGTKVYITNDLTSGSVFVIDTANGNATSTIPVGNSPQGIIAVGTKLYVANYGSSNVSVIDTANNNSVLNISVGSEPEVLTNIGSTIYVANYAGNSVSIIGTQYQLSYSAGSNGSISGSSTQAVIAGSNGNTVTAVPNSGYSFSSWSDSSTQNPRTDTNVLGNVTVTANFVANPVVTPPVVYASEGGGSVSVSDLASILAPGPATTAYLESRGYQVASISLPNPVVTTTTATTTSAASTSVIFTMNLSLGAINPEVLELQQYLNTHGFIISASGSGSPGNETDTFGNLTKASLAKFQKANGLPATGYFGPMTRAVVNG